MSTTVDQRVVEMRFDNKQFEQNVSATMSSLDKLKQKLNLSGATKGLENVDTAARRVDMSPLSNAVQNVGLKFNAMYSIADQALRNITNSAMAAGKRIVSSLTIDPIKTGFSEYETQINAVQTILANTESKGKTLEDVNGALDELNAYADKTIYNFTEMTRNIGTFTAAGVDLDTSVSAIKGIANLAAVSGSTSQQASTAMYQLSQAMASGTVKLMDWNSVVNAGMGGQVFQDALKETAKVHGVAIDDIISKQGSFRESLSEGWLTTEILTETLSKFTGDLSEEQLKSMGYTEEQIKGIMKMGQTANDAATKVKTFTQLFDTLKEAAQSGWTQTWEILVGDFEEAKELLTQISDVVGEFIGKSANARNELLENWKVMGGREDLIESFKNVFEGIISIVTPIKEAFRDIFPPMTAEQLVSFTKGLKDLTAKLKIGDETADKIRRTFKGLFAIFDIVKQAVFAVFGAIASLTGTVGEFGGGILGVTASIGDWLAKLSDTIRISGIFNKVLQGVVTVIKVIAGGIKSLLGFLKEKVVSPGMELFRDLLVRVADRMTFVKDVAVAMKNGVVAAFDAISAALASSSLFKILKSVWKGITIVAAGITKALGSLVNGLTGAMGKADFNGFIDILNSLITGGIIVKVIQFLKGIADPLNDMKEAVGGFLGHITGILDGVRGCLEGFQSKLKSDALRQIAVAIAVLAAALLVLSLIDSAKLASAIGAMTVMFVELSTALAVISKIDKGVGVLKVASAMTKLATSLLILAFALKIMSTLSLSEMGIGFVGIAGGLGVLVGAVKLLPEAKVKDAAKAIKKMSSALLVLSIAMKIMGSMTWSEMAIGLITMTVGLGALVAAVNLLPEQNITKSANAIVKLSASLFILSVAMKIMSTMSWQEMAVGLAATVGGLAALVAAVWLLPKDMAIRVAGMVGLATSLVILAAALKIMGGMTWQELAVGLVALAGSMTILAVALNAMTTALPGAAALLVATAALAVLTPVLAILGAMSWESIVKGLVSIAGAFAIIGVAGLVLQPIIPAILALAGAMALIGVGVLAAGVGLMAFGTGLSALAVGFTAIVASMGAVTAGIIAIVSSFVTGIIKGIGDGIVAFCEVITNAVPAITGAFVTVIKSICNAIIESVPDIINCIDILLTKLLNFIVGFIPKLVDAGVKIILGLLNGISRNIGKIVSAAVDVVISFINGVASQIPKVIQAGVDLMLKFINGLADGIRNNTPLVLNAVNNLMSAIFEAIGMAVGNIPNLGMQIAKGLAKGIRQGISSAVNAAKELGNKVLNGVKKFFKINSPSKKFAEIGMGLDEGMALGLSKYSNLVTKAAVGVGKSTTNSLSKAMSRIPDIINGGMDTQPTIRPVLDLSDVKAGAGSIGKMLGGTSSVGVLANVGAISSMMNQRNQNGGTDDVVSAINKLRKDLGKTGNTTYNIDGITYDDGSNITEAVKTLTRAVKIGRRT